MARPPPLVSGLPLANDVPLAWRHPPDSQRGDAHVLCSTRPAHHRGPEIASAAVLRVLAENKHRVVEQSSDGLQLTFLTKKTMFTWELAAQAAITPNGTGSTINIGLDTAAGRPAALGGSPAGMGSSPRRLWAAADALPAAAPAPS